MNSKIKINLEAMSAFQKDYSLTRYRIIYEISNRVKYVFIEAASPMLAFKKFKAMMPSLIYKNLAVHDVQPEPKKKIVIDKNEIKKCFQSSPFTISKTA